MYNLVYSETNFDPHLDDYCTVLTDEQLEDMPLLDDERLILRYHE